jgi:hypothetical protein
VEPGPNTLTVNHHIGTKPVAQKGTPVLTTVIIHVVIFGNNVTVCAKPGKDGRPLMKDGHPVQIDNCSQCANCALLKSNGNMGSSLCIPLQPNGYIYGDHNSQSLSDPSLWDTGNKNSVYLDCGDT